MGNTLAQCCSTDKKGDEETSTIIPKRLVGKTKNTSFKSSESNNNEPHKIPFQGEIICYQEGAHILKCNEKCRDCSTIGRRSTTRGSTVLDKIDADLHPHAISANDHILQSYKPNRFHDEDFEYHHEISGEEHGEHNLFDGKQGLMINQFDFTDGEIRAVFS